MDGEGVEVVGQDRPAGPNPLSLVAFEAAAPQPAAAFEVAAAALGAGAKSGPGAGGCAWSQARCVQRRCVTRRQGMAKLRSLSGLRSPWQAHRTRRPTAGSSAPPRPARHAPSNVVDQGMTNNDHPGVPVLLEAAHRPQPRLQPPMVALNSVVGRLLGLDATVPALAHGAPSGTWPLGR